MAVQNVSTQANPTLTSGPLQIEVSEGRLRVHWAGTEVIRQIDSPIRDPDWRTLPTEELDTDARRDARRLQLAPQLSHARRHLHRRAPG